MIELYPDQAELSEALRASLRRGNKSVLMQAATGSGKTILAANLIAGSRNKGTRSMMLVPRRELLKQTAMTLEQYEMPFTYIAAGHSTNPYAKTFLGIVPTLLKRLDKAPKLDVLIIDETHIGGEGLDRIYAHYKTTGTTFIGLSATPLRLDGKGLSRLYDDMVCGKPIRWLIDNNRLSDYRLFAPSSPDLSGIKTTAGDYNKGQIDDFMMQDNVLIGDAAKHYKQHAMGKLSVTFSTSRSHSMKIAEQYRAQGIPSYHIDGTMDDAERRRIITAFAKREILQLVNCDLLTFGFDLASAAGFDVTIEAMTDLRPTKSLALQMQKWGRVLRMKSFPAMIFDHSSNFRAHGLPCQDRQWSLDGMGSDSDEKKERVTAVRQCTKCFFCHEPAPKCPACGHVYPVKARELEHLDGELMEINTSHGVEEVNKKHKKQLNYLMKVARDKGVTNPHQWAADIVVRQMRGHSDA